jgi:hypothetical protein
VKRWHAHILSFPANNIHDQSGAFQTMDATTGRSLLAVHLELALASIGKPMIDLLI